MATNTENQRKREVGQAFVEHHQGEVIGVLHGWDRLWLQGTLRSLYYAVVMEQYLRKTGVLWKDFKRYAIGLTGRVCQAAEELGKQCQRPVIYRRSPGSGLSLDSGVAPRVDLVWHNTLYSLFAGTHGSDYAMCEYV